MPGPSSGENSVRAAGAADAELVHEVRAQRGSQRALHGVALRVLALDREAGEGGSRLLVVSGVDSRSL